MKLGVNRADVCGVKDLLIFAAAGAVFPLVLIGCFLLGAVGLLVFLMFLAAAL